MKTIITAVAFLITSLVSAQGQFEQGMGKAFGLWGEGKSAEASALFERIASAEKNNWLPSYYVAMVNTTDAFDPKNKSNASALLDKAQKALDQAATISMDNAEIMVLQAMIYTAWLVQDPMTNGMKYSALAMKEYEKALAIAPNNPRAVFGKAEFEMGGAKYWGTDTKPMCEQVARSIELFANFKPESAFHPKWGLERAQETLKSCK
jgi:tetratricopeptide (TPR) repeat protein